jgi:hypothetical protein
MVFRNNGILGDTIVTALNAVFNCSADTFNGRKFVFAVLLRLTRPHWLNIRAT